MKIIYIEWWDTIKQPDWTPLKESHHKFKTPTKTVGFFVKETEHSITIALSYDEETDMVSCFKSIPKVALKKRKYLKL